MRGILRAIPASYGVASPFVFDSVNDLAFSVRKVNPAYSGGCMRIRRSSDNTELEIGFVSGDLDTSAISAFCGAGLGYVTRWYDQSGNAKDKFNTTAVNQPVIYNNGFTLRNGKPYISATSTQWLYLANSYIQSGTQDYTFFMTYEKNITGNQPILVDASSEYSWLDWGIDQYVTASNFITISSLYAINTLYLNNTISDYDVSTEIFRNGVSIGTRGGNTSNGGLRYLPSNASRSATILFSEFIWFKADKRTTSLDMRNNINNYYSIY